MAGKIIADQIEHSTAGSLDTSYVVNGSAKAWGACTDAGVSRDSGTHNVSSISDGGADGKTFNYTSIFSSRAMSGIGQDAVGSRANVSGYTWPTASGTTASKIVVQYYNGSSYADTIASFISTGDLA